MTWLLLALLAPLFWSLATCIDKYIISKAPVSNGGSEGLIILSAFISLIFAGFLYFQQGSIILQLNTQNILILLLSGVFEVLYVYFYFLALEIESNNTVNALFLFAPVFGVLLGYIFIHEIPTVMQLIAIVIILIGTLCIVLKKDDIHFKWEVIILMGISTLFVALFGTFFRLGSESLPLWTAIFWEYVGIGVAGVLFFFISKKYKKQFFAMFKSETFFLISFAELLNIGAILATNAAVVLAPVAIVLSISSVQPLFVLAEGMILATVLPKYFADERPEFKLQYIIGLAFVIIGGFMIY